MLEMNLAELIDLLEQLVDDGDCHYDPHGYCQEHLWFYTDEVCPHKRATELLIAIGNNEFTLIT